MQHEIGTMLKAVRLYGHKTQQEVADISGLDRSSISCIEHGKQLPDIHTIEKIAKACGFEMVLTFQSRERTVDSQSCPSLEQVRKDLEVEKHQEAIHKLQGG